VALGREPQRERERDEPLLRAVVEVALQPAALGIAGLDDAGARRVAESLSSGSTDPVGIACALLEAQPASIDTRVPSSS
jgi:hypothetical protein